MTTKDERPTLESVLADLMRGATWKGVPVDELRSRKKAVEELFAWEREQSVSLLEALRRIAGYTSGQVSAEYAAQLAREALAAWDQSHPQEAAQA